MGEDLLCVASRPYDRPADIPHMAIRLGIERGVFELRLVHSRGNSSQTRQGCERILFDPDTFFKGILEPADPDVVQALKERMRKRLPVLLPRAITPLTKPALEELLDDAVEQARRFAQPEPYSSARRYEEHKP